jgi:hypothetical protein
MQVAAVPKTRHRNLLGRSLSDVTAMLFTAIRMPPSVIKTQQFSKNVHRVHQFVGVEFFGIIQ